MDDSPDTARAKSLEALGSDTVYQYATPSPALLERFANPFADPKHNPNGAGGEVNITAPEFTSLCPKTGQPDFATIVVNYEPGEWCVESKSFKLYLGSFRMHGEFHESCVARICNDLVNLLNPIQIEVVGNFTPRGGIPFVPRAYWHREMRDDASEAPAALDS